MSALNKDLGLMDFLKVKGHIIYKLAYSRLSVKIDGKPGMISGSL